MRRVRCASLKFSVHKQFNDERGDAQDNTIRQDSECYFEISDRKHFGRLVIFGIDRFVLRENVLRDVAVPLDYQSGLVDPRQQRVYSSFVRRMSKHFFFETYDVYFDF